MRLPCFAVRNLCSKVWNANPEVWNGHSKAWDRYSKVWNIDISKVWKTIQASHGNNSGKSWK